MTDLMKLIESYTVRRNQKIKKICSPLVNNLNIPIFAYYSIDDQGKFVIMSNYPDQLGFFYSEKLYLSCPYLVHPHFFRSGYALIPLTASKEHMELSRNRHQVDHLFLMLKKKTNKLEGCFFITKNQKESNAGHFIDKIDLLKKFALYFKHEARFLIESALEEGYNLREAKKESFFNRDPSLPLSSTHPEILSYLKQIRLLSSQEQKCLDLFKQGKTAKASAAALGLSTYTVQHYFESIKNKLGCDSKWDLLDW